VRKLNQIAVALRTTTFSESRSRYSPCPTSRMRAVAVDFMRLAQVRAQVVPLHLHSFMAVHFLGPSRRKSPQKDCFQLI